MAKVSSQIVRQMEAANPIAAVSEILDLTKKYGCKLCMTLTFANEQFLNVYNYYSDSNKEQRYREIKNLQDKVQEHLKKMDNSTQNVEAIMKEISRFIQGAGTNS